MYILLEFSLIYTNIGDSPFVYACKPFLCLIAYWMVGIEDGN